MIAGESSRRMSFVGVLSNHREETLERPESKHYRLAGSISQISSEMRREFDVAIAFPSGEIPNG